MKDSGNMNVNMLLRQERFVQVVGLALAAVLAWCFYLLAASLTEGMAMKAESRTLYVTESKPNVRFEVETGKSWLLTECKDSDAYCWEPITEPEE